MNKLNNDNYYDLETNRIYDCGGIIDSKFISSIFKDRIVKKLIYPKVLSNLYLITDNGIVFNLATQNILERRNSHLYYSTSRNMVLLSTLSREIPVKRYSMEEYSIIDLMAYNFIKDSKSYLERGYEAITIDEDDTNANYENIRYEKFED